MKFSLSIYFGTFWILFYLVINLQTGYASDDKYNHRIRSGARGEIRKRSTRYQTPIYIHRSRKTCLSAREFYNQYPPSQMLGVARLIRDACMNSYGMEKLSRAINTPSRIG